MHDRRHTNRPRTNRPRVDDHTGDTQRDASGGWRSEYTLQHVDDEHTTRPDGGRYILPSPGSRVRDRDDDDGEDLLVVRVRQDTRADRVHLDELANAPTVADVNPAYDPSAPVVEVAYPDDLERLDGWETVEDVREAAATGHLTLYTFPAPRLDDPSGGGRA
jgi:hypothetical protein